MVFRVESIETASGKAVDRKHCSGKLTVRLKTGEELAGKFVDGGREGVGFIIGGRLENIGVTGIYGNYEGGVLSGRGKVTLSDGSTREGTFQDGYFHGACRYISHSGSVFRLSQRTPPCLEVQ